MSIMWGVFCVCCLLFFGGGGGGESRGWECWWLREVGEANLAGSTFGGYTVTSALVNSTTFT